ncbi:hypothetical protein LMIY3S_03671 [Labrys miyagiensis]
MSENWKSFDWENDEDVALPAVREQPVAVYVNGRHEVVIRQRRDDGDDQFIVVKHHRIYALQQAMDQAAIAAGESAAEEEAQLAEVRAGQ